MLNQRWTLHILRGLLEGKMRFNEMVREHGVNPCTLRNRLRQLEKHDIISRRVVSTMPPNVEYSLTKKGLALGRIFAEMEDWGRRWMSESGSEAKL